MKAPAASGPEASAGPGGALVRVIDVFAWLGVAALLVPTLLICADIIWRRAIGGAFVDVFDIAQLGLVAVACWSIPFGFVHGSHVSIDLLLERLPARVQDAADALIHFICALLLGLLAWLALAAARLHHGYADSTQNLGIPVVYYWGVFLIGLILAVAACLWRVARVARRLRSARKHAA